MTTALIDGDIVAYRCAASCQKGEIVTDPLNIAIARAEELVHKILKATNASFYKIFLSGPQNYRYKINPQYKANRKDVPRPQWLQDLREYLVVEWKASVEEDQEADDALGIYQCHNKNTIICSIDKDLLMIPGHHYSWEISGTSVNGNAWVRPEEYLFQEEPEATRRFYYQMLMGDRSDNVFGFDGLARQKVPDKLQHIFHELDSYSLESDMCNFVRSLYNDDDRFLMNGQCLWIRRQEGEIWQPINPETMESGQKQDGIAL